MEQMVLTFLAAVADAVSIAAGGIAIYLLLTKRKEIGAVFNVLINFSFQTTLIELTHKLERLNEYRANDPDGALEIQNIFHEIAGQIRGNTRLSKAAPELPARIEALARKFTEPQKRSMVSEIREVLKNLNVGSIESYLGK